MTERELEAAEEQKADLDWLKALVARRNQEIWDLEKRPYYHSNVSRDGNTMTGNYPNCHNEDQPGKGRGHLNMFTSDFF
ncbi:MAG: hypothetical protein ACXW27_12940 [Allosphingosinicella sp.]